MKWLPVIMLAAGLISTASVGNYRLSVMADEVADQDEEMDQMQKLLSQLRETDIRTEGQLKLEVQKLNSNIANQSSKIDQLLQILQSERNAR